MHRRAGYDGAQHSEYDDDDDEYYDDQGKSRGLMTALDDFCGRFTSRIRIPRYHVNFVLNIIFQRPAMLLVVISLAVAFVYLGIYLIMPDHAHDRYAHASRHGPLYCIVVIAACVAWVMREKPIEIYDYTRGLGKSKPSYEDTYEDDHYRAQAQEEDLEKINKEV